MPSKFVENYMRHLHSSVLMADALLKPADVLSLESVPPSVPSSVPPSVPSSVPSSDTSSGPSPSFGPFLPFFFLLLPLPRPLPLFRFLPFPFPPAFASSVAHSVAPSPISVIKSLCKQILALHRKERQEKIKTFGSWTRVFAYAWRVTTFTSRYGNKSLFTF